MVRKIFTKTGALLAFILISTLFYIPQPASAKGRPVFLYMANTGTSASYAEFSAPARQLGGMLEEKIGSQVVVVVPAGDMRTSNEKVVDALLKGKADLVLLHLFPYLIAHEAVNAESIVIATAGGRSVYYAQFLANYLAGIDELGDLEGVDICWTDRLSTSGYIVPSMMLKAAGITEGTGSRFAGSHQNIVRQIHTGECAAGAVYVDVRSLLEAELPDVYDVVQVVEVSPTIPNPFGFSVSENVPPALVADLASALVEISQDADGLAVLQKLGLSTLVPMDHSQYLGLENLVEAAGMTPREAWELYFP